LFTSPLQRPGSGQELLAFSCNNMDDILALHVHSKVGDRNETQTMVAMMVVPKTEVVMKVVIAKMAAAGVQASRIAVPNVPVSHEVGNHFGRHAICPRRIC